MSAGISSDVGSAVSCDVELRSHPMVGLIEATVRDLSAFPFADHLSFLRRVATSDLPQAALKLALKRCAADPDYQLAQFVMEGSVKGWTFLVTDHFAMSIGIRSSQHDGPVPLPAKSTDDFVLPKIQPYPFDLLLGVIHAEDLEVKRFEIIEPARPNDDPALRFHSRTRMAPGDTLFLRAGIDVTVSQLFGTLIYVEITGPSTARTLPQFDAVSHQPNGWISGDPTASRLELLTRVLAEFERVEAVPEVLSLTWHQDHYVRWNSIRHLLRLAPDAGLTRLHQALDDQHPDVREVAQSTLAALATTSALGAIHAG